MAEERDVATISFPAISTGVYGYPPDEAARIAIREVKAHLERPAGKVRTAIFALFGSIAWQVCQAAMPPGGGTPSPQS
jgi:O-acetyl-ADP-ribose deacetylase (regulator of RNase III)